MSLINNIVLDAMIFLEKITFQYLHEDWTANPRTPQTLLMLAPRFIVLKVAWKFPECSPPALSFTSTRVHP